MHFKHPLLIIVLTLCLHICSAQAQVRFRNISTQSGLPQVSVNTILNDQEGFMWFGTQEGLARFDGYGFKVFHHQPDDPTSVSDSFIQVLLEAQDGTIWVGTRTGGLNHFDPVSELFTRYMHTPGDKSTITHNDITALLQSNAGDIWIGTNGGGLNRLQPNTGTFSVYTQDSLGSTGISDNRITAILEDQQGTIWVGTVGGGLNRYNAKEDHFEPIIFNAKSSNSEKITSLLAFSDQHLWIGTQGNGIFVFDKSTQQVYPLADELTNARSLNDKFITSMEKDDQGNVWIGTRSNGVDVVDLNKLTVKNYQKLYHSETSISDNSILTIKKDRQGYIWIGTYMDGVNFYSDDFKKFHYDKHVPYDNKSVSSNDVRAIMVDHAGTIWIGTSKGLDQGTIKDGNFEKIERTPNSSFGLSDNIVGAITEDKQQNLWVGTQGGGVNRIERETMTAVHYRHDANDKNSLSEDYVLSLKEDSQGSLWVGTLNGGLNKFDPTTQTFQRFTHDPKVQGSLSNNSVRVVYEDSQGDIWLGTNKGLNKFSPQQEKFSSYTFSSNSSSNAIRDIFEDSVNRFWVGTRNGLFLFDRQTLETKQFVKTDGLPNNVIYQILEDDSGNLWLSTNKGLSKFNPDSLQFINYSKGDGIGNTEFTAGASFRSLNGEMFFGGTEGVTRFFPGQIREDNTPPKVVVTQIYVSNQVAQIRKPSAAHSGMAQNQHLTNPHFELDKASHLVNEIDLEYNQNIITFEFSALHYLNPEKNRFMYKLIGFDKAWVETDYKNRRATYTSLPAGRYEFWVKASNPDGVWNEASHKIRINVHPPFWKTWWAYAFYGVLFMLVLVKFVNAQRKKVLLERSLKLELEYKVAERTKELESATRKLEELSQTDQLTKLKNRRFLDNHIHEDIKLVHRRYRDNSGAQMSGTSSNIDLVFFVLDLDFFKQINDVHGHLAGDAVLIQIKSILNTIFRESDYLIRWGGEEFLIVARFINRHNAPVIAEKLRDSISHYQFDIGQESCLQITCSIGFAPYPLHTKHPEKYTWEQVVHVADNGLYAAKKSSRNAWIGIELNADHEPPNVEQLIEHPDTVLKSGTLKVSSSMTDLSAIKWQ